MTPEESARFTEVMEDLGADEFQKIAAFDIMCEIEATRLGLCRETEDLYIRLGAIAGEVFSKAD